MPRSPSAGSAWIIREVSLICDQEPLVAGRTLFDRLEGRMDADVRHLNPLTGLGLHERRILDDPTRIDRQVSMMAPEVVTLVQAVQDYEAVIPFDLEDLLEPRKQFPVELHFVDVPCVNGQELDVREASDCL